MQKKEPGIDLKSYLAILLRRKFIVLFVGLGVLSVFTWGSFIIPKSYRASAILSIERSTVLNPLIQGVGVSQSMEDRLRNVRNELMSRSIAEKAIKSLGLDAEVKNPAQFEGLVSKIIDNLEIQVQGPYFFHISYTGEDPQRVTAIVNAVTQAYIDQHMSTRRTDVADAYEFIHGQLMEYKRKLEESDGAIREFREKNPNLVMRSETALVSKLETLENAKKDAQIRLREFMSMRDNLKEQIASEKELTVAFVSRENSPVDARLSALNNQLVLLMMKYTDKYPEVIKVKSEIEELKKHAAQKHREGLEGSSSETAAMNPVYQRLKEQITVAESEIASLKARLAEITHQQREVQAILGSMPKEQEEWTKLQRDRTVLQQIYDQLLQKLENAKVSKDIEIAEKGEVFRFVDAAKVPLSPYKPNRVHMILLGLLLGLASGIGIVFALEYFDHSFKDEDSIESTLKLPVLATIPKIVSEADALAEKIRDRKVYIASGVYLSLIGLLLVGEVLSRYMGVTLIHF